MNIAVTMEGTKLRPSMELLRSAPLLDDLSEAELAQIAGFFTAEALGPGETLYAEGAPATCACILVSGALEAFARLPGGGEARLAAIEPGAIIGEMALLTGGLRTASVRARGGAKVLEVPSSFFQASLGRMDLPAHKILRRVVGVLAARLSVVSDRIVAAMAERPASAPMAAVCAPSASPASPSADRFDVRRFLPLLPGLGGLRPEEVERILTMGALVARPARSRLYDEGAPAQAAYLVLRGAVECAVRRGEAVQLAVIGPGRLCGANEIITGQDRKFGAATRTGALLLELGRDAFAALFHGETTERLKFQQIIGHNQLSDLKAANNLLALLVNQAQIRTGSQPARTADQALT